VRWVEDLMMELVPTLVDDTPYLRISIPCGQSFRSLVRAAYILFASHNPQAFLHQMTTSPLPPYHAHDEHAHFYRGHSEELQ
jgi:hypothetical protein